MIFIGLSESASPVINGYEIKSFSDIKLQTKKIASCLSSYEKTFRALREAELSRLDKSKTGFQVDDLIYVGGKASCIGSLFYKYNFLLFKNFEKNSFFYLIQSNIVCAGFYIPEYDLLLAKPGVLAAFKKGSSAARLKKRLSRHLSLNKRSSMPAMLSGWLDGYPRPYHYFYDRLPSLIRYKNFCSDLQSTSLPVYQSQAAFVEMDGATCIDFQKNEHEPRSGEFFFQGSRITSSGYEDSFLIQDYLERLDPGYKVFLDPLSKSHELVWIGLSEEKRKWRGKKDAIIRLIDKSINLLSSPVFVFDGLTCPAFKSVGEFKVSSCVRELTLLGEILREVGNIPYIDLIGEKSDKKIITSQYVDFYFSSALTDSMWPAHFGNSKGIAYSSTIAKLSVHRHPLTYKIPSNFISDADDGISNWSQKGFEVDPFALDSIMEDGIKFTSELISEANKFGVFEDAGQQRGVAIKTKQGRDKAVLLVNTESPVTISPYGSDRQEGFSITNRKISFIVSYHSKGSVYVNPYLIIYSEKGHEIEKLELAEGEGVSFIANHDAKFFKLFFDFLGVGEVFYNGFYAQGEI